MGGRILLSLLGMMCFSACTQQETESLVGDCQIQGKAIITNDEGQGLVFDIDPIVASNNPLISPLDIALDQHRSEVTLKHLSGKGILDGRYVTVPNSIQCRGLYLAYDELNQFQYSTDQPEFREVMAYYYGTEFRDLLDQNGYLEHPDPIRVDAQCRFQDNAFYVRSFRNGEIQNRVCLGASIATFGAHYADDSTVTIHELQHSVTVNHYSLTQDLNQFLYDEAGSINEAISDFISLLVNDRENFPSQVDRRTFSRWALGQFFGSFDGSRGMHLCSKYDAGFPDCTHYANDASGFSADNNLMSYSFPDGMGWPYGDNYSGPGYLRNAFVNYSAQEEIHNAGVFFGGALWDAYEDLAALSGTTRERAKTLMLQLTLESIRNLPKPTVQSLSPVTFVGFAEKMLEFATPIGFTTAEKESLRDSLRNRGLIDAQQLSNQWAILGPGKNGVTGIHILDHPNTLRNWIARFGYNPNSIPQGPTTGLNGRFDSGEIVAVWFNIENQDAITAGSLQITAKSNNSNLSILGPGLNFGYVDQTQAQIRYSKINGSAIVGALSSTQPQFHVPTGNTYFDTNPRYDTRPYTAIWMRVEGQANDPIDLEIKVKPENGPEQILNIQTTIIN